MHTARASAARSEPAAPPASARGARPSSRRARALAKRDFGMPERVQFQPYPRRFTAAPDAGQLTLQPMSDAELSAIMEQSLSDARRVHRRVGKYIMSITLLLLFLLLAYSLATGLFGFSLAGGDASAGVIVALNEQVLLLLVYVALAVLLLALHPTPAEIVRIRALALTYGLLFTIVMVLNLLQMLEALAGSRPAPAEYSHLGDDAVGWFAGRLGLSVGIRAVCLCAFFYSIARNWRVPARLLKHTWQITAVIIALAMLQRVASFVNWARADALGAGALVDWFLAVLAVLTILNVALTAVVLAPGSRLRLQAWLGALAGSTGLDTALAPFAGYGSLAGAADPRELVASAMGSFRALTLEARTLDQAELQSALADRASLGLHAQRHAISPARPSLVPEPAQRAEAFVVTSVLDHPREQARALGEWLRARTAATGKPSTVYLPPVCSPNASALEHAKHAIVHLAKCERLVLLAGVNLFDDILAATLCFLWLLLGGRLEDIDVHLAVSDAAEAQSVVAAIDAFHVTLAVGRRPPDAALNSVLLAMVEAASVRTFNHKVRELLPLVVGAVRELKPRRQGV